MKTKTLDKQKSAAFIVDKRLNKFDNQVLFPQKLKEVKELIAKAGLPWSKKQM